MVGRSGSCCSSYPIWNLAVANPTTLRKLTQMVNKLKIETSISLRMRDEEVEIHGKSNCWDIGRR